MRAAGTFESDISVRCPDTLAREFLGGINVTSLARRRWTSKPFVRAINRRAPGVYATTVARCRLYDDLVRAECAAGLDEIVLLGAGMDSIAYRLADDLGNVRVIEVDHPASQATKRAKLREIFGQLPAHVTYVPFDFTEPGLADALADAGHDPSAATLFVWTAISMYLDRAAVASLLAWVASHDNPRTSIAFDAIWQEAIDGSTEYFGARELREHVNAIGEPLRWGIPEGRVNETISAFGLKPKAVFEPAEIAERYLTRADGTQLGRPYGFGVVIHAIPAAVE